MNQIDLTMTVDGSAPDAERLILDRVGSRLDEVGLTRQTLDGALAYRPKFVGLPLVWLVRRLQGEGVTFTFTEQGPVTQVRAAGKLRDRAHAEVTEALGGD
jgi:hypothetical protein